MEYFIGWVPPICKFDGQLTTWMKRQVHAPWCSAAACDRFSLHSSYWLLIYGAWTSLFPFTKSKLCLSLNVFNSQCLSGLSESFITNSCQQNAEVWEVYQKCGYICGQEKWLQQRWWISVFDSRCHAMRFGGISWGSFKICLKSNIEIQPLFIQVPESTL